MAKQTPKSVEALKHDAAKRNLAPGLKARHVTAQAGGLGKTPLQSIPRPVGPAHRYYAIIAKTPDFPLHHSRLIIHNFLRMAK